MKKTELSVVIPVHQEEALLEVAVRRLLEGLDGLGRSYELLLAENGSRDGTLAIARRLAQEHSNLRVLHTSRPNYGAALKRGILAAAGTFVVCDEIDLGDVDFYKRALRLLEEGADMVVGSKRHPQSCDDRPWVRRAGTAVINGLLWASLGFDGTDTHGVKAFRREALLAVVQRCVVEHDLFASELVVRASRDGLEVRELPLILREIRPPSVNLWRRVPRVLWGLSRLVYRIRVRG